MPRWKKWKRLGAGFLVAAVLILVAERLIDGLTLTSLGLGFWIGGLVILAGSYAEWRTSRDAEREE